MTTPADLARELDVPARTIRAWLRAEFPRTPAEQNQRWHLSDEVAAAVRAHFRR